MTANIDLILENQKKFFRSGATLSVDFRVEMLKKLYETIKEYKDKIAQALHEDLGKSEFESFMCETGMALTEISYMIKNAGKLSAKRKVSTPLAQFPSVSYQKPVPYGTVLIMSPWNYPFLLTVDPCGGQYRRFEAERVFSRNERADRGDRFQGFPARIRCRGQGRKSGKRKPSGKEI